MSDAQSIVIRLLNEQQEGQYWDFKRQHHEHSGDLLHDIICLANTERVGDRYLVFGVEETTSGLVTVGVDSTKRRSQADIIDVLRQASFAGGRRPNIVLYSVDMGGALIDLLVVRDEPYKPFYLTKSFGKQPGKVVRPFHIYSRKLDTNTPIDSSADEPDLERMWRERFGLNAPPRDRMLLLLRDPHWEKDLGNSDTAYHRLSPEYRIEFSEPKTIREAFSYFFTNEDTALGEARFLYHSTLLFKEEFVLCDGWRLWYPAPNNGMIEVHGQRLFYFYYLLDSSAGAFLHLLTEGNFDFRDYRGGVGPFLVFDNREARETFDAYVATTLTAAALKDAESRMPHVQRRLQDAGISSYSAGRMDLLRTIWRDQTWKIAVQLQNAETSNDGSS